MACEVRGCGVGLHRTNEHYADWDKASLHRAILNLTISRENLITALCALGVKPDGYCFCLTEKQAKDGHTGECREARAALAACGEEVGS